MRSLHRSGQLRLVRDDDPAAPTIGAADAGADPTRSVFDHWLYMTGRSPRRCKLGPTRRQAINAALTIYLVDDVLLAVEGMASDPLEGCSQQQAEAMRELEWLLAKESRIERWATRGEKLRASAERAMAAEAQARAVPAGEQREADAAAAASAEQARERLRSLALQLREGGR